MHSPLSTQINPYRIVSLIALVILACSQAFSQMGPPDLTCVRTDDFGHVTFQWNIPPDPDGEFVEYQIWKASTIDAADAAPFAIVNSYVQDEFAWIGANAGEDLSCFFIQTLWADASGQAYSISSDTICNILLTVDNSLPGIAALEWQGPYTETGAPADEFYIVNRMDDLGVWSVLADNLPIDLHGYDDIIASCAEFYTYQITIDTDAGCTSESNIVADIFSDGSTPDIPSITTVTVDSITSNAVINWTPSIADDTWGYIIYECDQFGEQPVDTVYVADQNEFENVISSANLWPEAYLVAAFDSCVVGGDFINLSPTDGNCNQTIHLNPPSFFNCQNQLTLSWSPYIGWPDDVNHYEIIFRENGSLDQIAGVVDGNGTTFIHENLTFGATYKYFIKAYAEGVALTSLSNGSPPITIQVDQAPTDNYLMSASVLGKNETIIAVQSIYDVAGGLAHEYILERKDSPTDDFDFVESQWFSGGSNVFTFSDFDVDTRFTSYVYRVQVMNDCGDTVATTNIGRTIELSGLANNANTTNTISWTPYEQWDVGVDYYNIYRSQEPGVAGQLIGTISGPQAFFEDNVSDMIDTPGYFCYTVEAVELENQYGYSMTSTSNEVCLQQEPKVWIPNTFMVNGNNTSFYPVISFADFNTFSMIIYSRWGDIIHNTADIDDPWRGKKDGVLVPEGGYAYYIAIKDGRGQQHEYRGTVHLLIGAIE